MITTHNFINDKKSDITDPYTMRDSFYEHVFKEEQENHTDCPICMDADTEVVTGCQHQYCRQCIYQWCDLRGTCPMCRTQFLKIF